MTFLRIFFKGMIYVCFMLLSIVSMLRTFNRALILCSVCEEVCDEPNIFDDGLVLMESVNSINEAKVLAKDQDQVAALEERVINWMKKVQEVDYYTNGGIL